MSNLPNYLILHVWEPKNGGKWEPITLVTINQVSFSINKTSTKGETIVTDINDGDDSFWVVKETQEEIQEMLK